MFLWIFGCLFWTWRPESETISTILVPLGKWPNFQEHYKQIHIIDLCWIWQYFTNIWSRLKYEEKYLIYGNIAVYDYHKLTPIMANLVSRVARISARHFGHPAWVFGWAQNLFLLAQEKVHFQAPLAFWFQTSVVMVNVFMCPFPALNIELVIFCRSTFWS